jgi:pimeloyl-[acyl-carrier protein] methyl ester esterase
MGGRSFARQLDLIADGFEVIAPDLPGFAGSPIPQNAPNIETMSEMVRDLIQTLDLDDVILVGWSMGASIAWHLASTDSVRVNALVSIDMSPRVAPAEDWLFALSTGITSETIQAAMLAMRSDWSGYCDLFLDRILAKPDDAIRRAMAELAALADPETASQAWSALMHFDARAGLSRIHVPALAIHGGRSVIYPQTVGHEIARLMPHCQAIVLDHVGHAPHIEAPEAFNAHLRTLAKRGPPAPTLCQHMTAQ